MERNYENDIAIIGMSGRFPKAKDIDAFWENLTGGFCSVQESTEDQITQAGVPKELLNHSRFVNASSKLEGAKCFDANFFGLSNTEATLMDPQIRLLLQTSWHALEDAGYAKNNLDFPVGNFCGMSTNSYLMKILKTNALNEIVDPLMYRILNEKDFLATWVSYKLNLTGPVFTVQTACSTSLLAIHLACQSLLNYECTMALAGGASYDSEDGIGYVHVPGSIYSKDGLCRPFDKNATGTIMGDGVGTIVLKRAEDAIKDKDHIYALIKGTASNNDGANKQGYTTPSVNFQRDVVLETLAVTDIDPTTIGMIEAHGTGTLIGDPIEVAALTEAFREYTTKGQFCAIGSVKSNLGHLDAAAGIASTIKAALCVNKGVLVPSINFTEPNPSLDIDQSPFYISKSYSPWPDHFNIRRAGVSSLGVGGTNVHLIIEEPPPLESQTKSKERPFIVSLSAQNEHSLNLQKQQFAEYVDTHPDLLLGDIEFTSLYGRKLMNHRFSVVCQNKKELLAQLKGEQHEKCFEGYGEELGEPVFLFPGQGSQYPNMAASLYKYDEGFKKDMDYCFDYIKTFSSFDFQQAIFSEDSTLLNKTENTQISLFIVEYCLAKKLISYGIKPTAVMGHSLGEYVAACVIGCLSLEDALKLVYHRGRLMGAMPEGAMVLVRRTEEELRPSLLDAVSICAFNAQNNIVIGGTHEAIEKQCSIFDAQKIDYKKLKVSHAYHTSMMQNMLEEYEQILSEVEFKEFETKVFSTYLGSRVSPEVFCSPKYWLDQIMHPVEFLDAALDIMNYLSDPIFIEAGPGSGLSYFINTIFNNQASTLNLLPKASAKKNALDSFYEGLAILCAKGLVFDLPETHIGKRVSLPGYAFSNHYFWKPKQDIVYNDFNQLSESYHFNSEKYRGERLRTSVEINLDDQKSISKELFDKLSELHTEYISGIKELFASKEGNVNDRIEALYIEDTFEDSGNHLSDSSSINKNRKVNSVFVEPKTDTEKGLAVHWANVLGYQPVGVLDNYFEVGGNSLLATQLINRINTDLKIEVTVAEILSNNTIKDLAALVEEKQWLRSDVELSGELII